MKGNILYLYETTVGLGHQRRASGIVNGLIHAGHDVSVASGTFVDPADYFLPEANLVELTALRKKKPDGYYFYDENNHLTHDPFHDPLEWNRKRVETMADFAAREKIDVIMAEWWPFQRRVEFNDIIEKINEVQMRRFYHKPMMVSSVRDVLTNFEQGLATEPTSDDIAALRLIENSVDHLLIHGDPAFVKLSDTFAWHSEIRKPVQYTGYVVNEGARVSALGRRDDTVYISCGSGDQGHHLLKAVAQARPYSMLKNYEWVYVMGPRMAEDHQAEFKNLVETFNRASGNLPQQIHLQLPDLPTRLIHAGFSISYAGYNTTIETLSARVPGILVPKMSAKPGDPPEVTFDREQWSRVRRLEEYNMAQGVHPDELQNPVRFAEIIDEAYTAPHSRAALDMDGASKTAQLIGDLIASRSGFGPKPQDGQEFKIA